VGLKLATQQIRGDGPIRSIRLVDDGVLLAHGARISSLDSTFKLRSSAALGGEVMDVQQWRVRHQARLSGTSDFPIFPSFFADY
jgi:hypothetical protein